MSTSHSAPSSVRISLPPSVRRLLNDVRSRTRRDAAVSGFLLLVCSAAAVFWVTTGIDLGWFSIQHLELPVGLRVILLCVLTPAAVWLTGSRVLVPLFRRVTDNDIAILLERRFPQFKDRLITTVEAVQGLPEEGPLVSGMLQRTVGEAKDLAGAILPDEVFDTGLLKTLGMRAGLLVISIAVFGVVQPGSLSRWWKAFVRCDAVYHQRTTDLEIYAVAQPGDRRVEFKERNEERIYLHPRGADLELELIVPEGGPPTGGTWIVPDRVRVDVIRSDGSVSRSYVSSVSERVFRFAVPRLQDPIRVEFLAGDYRTPETWRIEPVSPPGLDSVRLACRFPEYTGWNEQRETLIAVTGSEAALPLGTEFEIQADSSKRLRSVRLVTDWFELEGDADGSRVIPRQGFTIRDWSGMGLISADGKSISATFRVIPTIAGSEDAAGANASAAEPGAGDATGVSPAVEPAGLSDFSESQLPIASNTAVRFFLHDEDDVMTINPEILRIRGIEDRPPVIVARGFGIDNAVTRLAGIPITGQITDDYGLATAGFQFLVDDESSWRPRPFRRSVPSSATEFELSRGPREPYEVFEVQPLELTEGQTLTLAVTATDRNTLTGPGSSRSEPLVFRIVSNEDLLSLLYTREITLRRRLEEVISQLEQVRDDLQFHQEIARRADAGGDAVRAEDRVGLTTCAVRSANSLRRQTNELKSVAEGFEEIVQQLINNSIPPQQLAQNMRDQILSPILKVAGQPLNDADRALAEFSVAARSEQPTEQLIVESEKRVFSVIVDLKTILESVRDLAEFHEALRDLKAILEDQQRLTDEIKALQKRALIDKL